MNRVSQSQICISGTTVLSIQNMHSLGIQTYKLSTDCKFVTVNRILEPLEPSMMLKGLKGLVKVNLLIISPEGFSCLPVL